MPDAAPDLQELDEALVSPGFVYDPYPLLARLRELDPVHWSESVGGWILTRHDDILASFKDVSSYSNEGRLGHAADYLPAESRRRLETLRRTTERKACCTQIRQITRACAGWCCELFRHAS